MLSRMGPARGVRTVPVPIWPRALQYPGMGLPHEFHVVQTIYAKNFFLKIIKNVSLLACFNFWLRLKIESQIKPLRLAHVRPRPNRYGSRTGSPHRPCIALLVGKVQIFVWCKIKADKIEKVFICKRNVPPF